MMYKTSYYQMEGLIFHSRCIRLQTDEITIQGPSTYHEKCLILYDSDLISSGEDFQRFPFERETGRSKVILREYLGYLNPSLLGQFLVLHLFGRVLIVSSINTGLSSLFLNDPRVLTTILQSRTIYCFEEQILTRVQLPFLVGVVVTEAQIGGP